MDATPALAAAFLERVQATALATADSAARAVLVERRARASELMAPLHTRDEEESVYVVEGELTFFVADEVVRARAGDVVVVPAETVRTLRVESDGARWLVLTRVASPERFEDFGRALGWPLDHVRRTRWATPEEQSTLAAIAAPNDIVVLGPPGMLPDDLADGPARALRADRTAVAA